MAAIRVGAFLLAVGLLSAVQVQGQTPTSPKDRAFACVFATSGETRNIENCARKQANGAFKIEPEVLKSIDFDRQGLAGGSIGQEGCYWLNKKGTLRKTLCFDNGADAFQSGLARFQAADGRVGYMDESLRVRIPARYTFAFPFDGPRATVCKGCRVDQKTAEEHSLVKGGTWFVIDKSGRVIKKCPASGDGGWCK